MEETELNLDHSRGGHSTITVFLWLAALALVVPAIFAAWLWLYAGSAGPQTSAQAIVYIPPQTSFAEINQILIRSDIINDDYRFLVLARLLGAANHLKAGEYRFTTHITPYNVLRELQQGSNVKHTLTIAEGLNIWQVADIIGKSFAYDRGRTATGPANHDAGKTFMALSRNTAFIKELGLNTDNLEGFLFPDTYFFKKGIGIKDIIRIMVRQTKQVFADECAQQQHNGLEINCDLAATSTSHPTISVKNHRPVLYLTARQALTLASMVEKETAAPDERPIIAQVFISRLQKKMRLQSDPTVMYGLQKFGTPLSRHDLKTPTPYNTYTLPALPASPICNPGRAAIRAVMRPADTDYYYFVSQNNGRHTFSKNLHDHNRAVRQFRQKITNSH